jgi:hypothetical protein
MTASQLVTFTTMALVRRRFNDDILISDGSIDGGWFGDVFDDISTAR